MDIGDIVSVRIAWVDPFSLKIGIIVEDGGIDKILFVPCCSHAGPNNNIWTASNSSITILTENDITILTKNDTP